MFNKVDEMLSHSNFLVLRTLYFYRHTLGSALGVLLSWQLIVLVFSREWQEVSLFLFLNFHFECVDWISGINRQNFGAFLCMLIHQSEKCNWYLLISFVCAGNLQSRSYHSLARPSELTANLPHWHHCIWAAAGLFWTIHATKAAELVLLVLASSL